jgi:hypothetical protein
MNLGSVGEKDGPQREDRRLQIIEYLVEQKHVDIESIDEEGQTLLIAAAGSNGLTSADGWNGKDTEIRLKVMKKLIELGANPSKKSWCVNRDDRDGMNLLSPLGMAMFRNGDELLQIIETLVGARVNINEPVIERKDGSKGYTAIQLVARVSQVGLVLEPEVVMRTLIERGASIDKNGPFASSISEVLKKAADELIGKSDISSCHGSVFNNKYFIKSLLNHVEIASSELTSEKKYHYLTKAAENYKPFLRFIDFTWIKLQFALRRVKREVGKEKLKEISISSQEEQKVQSQENLPTNPGIRSRSQDEDKITHR